MSSALPARSASQANAAAMGVNLAGGSLREAFAVAGEFGLLGAHLPEALGGGGLDGAALADAWEGAGESGPAGRLFAMAAHAFAVVAPLAHHGTAGARVLPELIAGRLLGAHAASESEAGSDVMSMKSRAVRDGAEHVLSGEKLFVTNGADADVFVVFAQVEGDGPHAFLLERGAPGLTVGPAMKTMGLEQASLVSLTLDDCRVPETARVGAGRDVFGTAMRYERSLILAPQVGAMRQQLERAIAHARTRRQFGRPIGKQQLVAARVVDMYERYVLARSLLRETAAAAVEGRLGAPMACLTKLRLSEWALEQHLDAIRVHGGSGYIEDTGLPQALRDAVGGLLYSGTSDLQRVILAAHLGL